MRKLLSKKRIAMAAGVLVVALGATAAFAYWTATGTGSGNATAGTDNGVSITNIAFSGGLNSGHLYPGATVNVAFDVNNLSDSAPVKVGGVVADQGTRTGSGTVGDPYVYQWPGGISTSDANCSPSWFTYSGTTLNQEIAHNATYSAPAGAGAGNGGTLAMSDPSDTNQNACKSATITLHLKTDNSSL